MYNAIGLINVQEAVEYIMVSTSRRARNVRWAPQIDEERMMWFGKKEKSLILIFYFGQRVRCTGKDWIGVTGPYGIEKFKNILGQSHKNIRNLSQKK